MVQQLYQTLITTACDRSCAVLSCHSFFICQNILASTLRGHQGSDKLAVYASGVVCVCVWEGGIGASTTKAKQAALIWRDLWLPLIISLGVRSWVWLLRTLILSGPSACSLIIACWAAVDGITDSLDLVRVKFELKDHVTSDNACAMLHAIKKKSHL